MSEVTLYASHVQIHNKLLKRVHLRIKVAAGNAKFETGMLHMYKSTMLKHVNAQINVAFDTCLADETNP